MITPRQAVLASAATYGAAPATWSSFGGAVRIFQSTVRDELIVAVEGTHDTFGWALDFAAWPAGANEPVPHPTLPPMHHGFHDALISVIDPIATAVKNHKWNAVGHSLGGAVALAMGAWLADAGRPPEGIFLFAPARVFTDAPDVLANRGVPIFGWRCGGDDVPMAPPLYWRPLLTHFPGPADKIACHHIENFTAFIQ